MGVEADIGASSQYPVQAETADVLQGCTTAAQVACRCVYGIPTVEDGDSKSQSWWIGHARIQKRNRPPAWCLAILLHETHAGFDFDQ